MLSGNIELNPGPEEIPNPLTYGRGFMYSSSTDFFKGRKWFLNTLLAKNSNVQFRKLKFGTLLNSFSTIKISDIAET